MRKKILLVDDSKTVLMLEQMLLGDGSYDLVTASDGVEAVERALAERPHLVLLDVVMPRKDGYAACREMRALEATRETPIIMVTTRGAPFDVETAFENGCSDFVTKPIDGLELVAKVRSLLGE